MTRLRSETNVAPRGCLGHQANILAMVEGLEEGQPQLLKVLLADFGEAKQLSQVRAASLLPTEHL